MVETVVKWARRREFPSITLTTFRHLPWNGPFYRRLGFEELSDAALTKELAEQLECEAAEGLDRSKRVAMRLDLTSLFDPPIRSARPEEAETLSALALRSKAYWGYPADFMEACREELTLTPMTIAVGRCLVANRSNRTDQCRTACGYRWNSGQFPTFSSTAPTSWQPPRALARCRSKKRGKRLIVLVIQPYWPRGLK